MAKFFHFEGSVGDNVVYLSNIFSIYKTCTIGGAYIIELNGPSGQSIETIKFENKEERDESYEKLKRTLLTI